MYRRGRVGDVVSHHQTPGFHSLLSTGTLETAPTLATTPVVRAGLDNCVSFAAGWCLLFPHD